MDSGNSSSMQSSSGGDEEYDSRGEPISAFLGSTGSFSSLSHHPSQLPTTFPRQHHPPPPPSSLFDPISSYLDAFTRSPPPPPLHNSDSLNLDMPWSSGLRASGHPGCTNIGGLPSAELAPGASPIATLTGPNRGLYAADINVNPLPSPSSSPLQPPSSGPPSADPPNPSAAAAAQPRSSRKRSRASRRAPTTVLTTDTSNFRAMVQEFTGIPAPPFSSSSMFPRARLDLFHATASPAMLSSGIFDAAPHPLLRPFPQKVPVPSFPFGLGSSSSSAPTITATAANATTSSTTTAESSIIRAFASNATAANTSTTSSTTDTTSIASSYQLPSNATLGDQHQNLLNAFNFQSFIQPSPTRYNSPDMAALAGSRALQVPRMMPAADYSAGSGLRHGNLAAASEGMPSLRGGGGGGGDDLLQWIEGPGGSECGDQGRFGPAGGSDGDSTRGSGCKWNCTGSASSEHHAEKGPENVPASGEGMLDSWICSSD